MPAEPTPDDPVNAFIAYVEGYAATLAQIGTPEALAAGGALTDAMRMMVVAFRQMESAFAAAEPTQH